jgi:hypothetical protein
MSIEQGPELSIPEFWKQGAGGVPDDQGACLRMLAETTLCHQLHVPPAKQLEVRPVQGLEVEVQDSVSRHTSLLLTRSPYVPCTMERLEEKLSVLCSR